MRIEYRQKLVIAGVVLFALTVGLSSFTVDLGMGSILTLCLADLALHPCARFLKTPWQLVCFALPVIVSQILWGYAFTIPRIVVVRLVCVVVVSKIYRGLPDAQKDRSILPFMAHGFWLVLGESMYSAMVSGLLQLPVGFLISIVEWVIVGGASVLFMRLLRGTVFRDEWEGEDE